MAFGSFDILHEGHKHYLQEAKSYGDYLIVVVARDSNILKFKHQPPKNNENFRLEKIKELDFVDEAILGNEKDIFKVLTEHNPNVICLGYDQSTSSEENLITELEKRNVKAEIVRAKSYIPEKYKSSKLK
ncbi:adenylyltransferase/cytidyltransferase family protein [Candidatus Woesearchaeota archaeon]|nr:adenylyltransferase/cytidyltransferase family protein [Candidatus Woesearchaeota archaeon]